MSKEKQENPKTVLIHVQDDKVTATPNRLKVDFEFSGVIQWVVATPNWELSPDNGIAFRAKNPFRKLSPALPGVWSVSVDNTRGNNGHFHYDIFVQSVDGKRGVLSEDPVIENEPPPTIIDPPPLTKQVRSLPASGHSSS